MCEFKSRLSQHFCLHMYCIFPYRTNQLRTDYVLHIESIILWIKICEIIVLTVLKSILNWVTPFTWQALLKINFKTVNTVSSQTFNHKIGISFSCLLLTDVTILVLLKVSNNDNEEGNNDNEEDNNDNEEDNNGSEEDNNDNEEDNNGNEEDNNGNEEDNNGNENDDYSDECIHIMRI